MDATPELAARAVANAATRADIDAKPVKDAAPSPCYAPLAMSGRAPENDRRGWWRSWRHLRGDGLCENAALERPGAPSCKPIWNRPSSRWTTCVSKPG